MQMVGHGAKFGRKKEQAIVALLTHRNVEEAARAVGIGTTTLLRWLKLPEFQKLYREAKRAAFGQSTARLHYLTSAAVSTLGKVLLDPATPPSTRVRAADSILNHTLKAIETEDIERPSPNSTHAADNKGILGASRIRPRRIRRMGTSAPSARDRQPERLFDQPRARFPHAVQPGGTAPAAHIAFFAVIGTREPLRCLPWTQDRYTKRPYRSVSQMLNARIETKSGNRVKRSGSSARTRWARLRTTNSDR
jgi:hypothetical protein